VNYGKVLESFTQMLLCLERESISCWNSLEVNGKIHTMTLTFDIVSMEQMPTLSCLVSAHMNLTSISSEKCSFLHMRDLVRSVVPTDTKLTIVPIRWKEKRELHLMSSQFSSSS